MGLRDLLQIDSIFRFKDGIKRYILTAIDYKTGFFFTHGYSHLSSKILKPRIFHDVRDLYNTLTPSFLSPKIKKYRKFGQ
jgi:hypothetical protein